MEFIVNLKFVFKRFTGAEERLKGLERTKHIQRPQIKLRKGPERTNFKFTMNSMNLDFYHELHELHELRLLPWTK